MGTKKGSKKGSKKKKARIVCRPGYEFSNHRYRNTTTGNCVSKYTATGSR